MNDALKYKKEMKILQSQRRARKEKEKEEHNNEVKRLREKYNVPPKGIVTIKDLIYMISHVLETGKNGTKAIRKYAEETGKTNQWKKDIAKYKAGKSFEMALREHENNPIIKSMKANNVYDEKDLLNNTITGALRKLSKQMEVSRIIDDLRVEVATLKENLAAKIEGGDWKEEAQRLRDSGVSLSKIAEMLGVHKSTVGKYTTGRQ